MRNWGHVSGRFALAGVESDRVVITAHDFQSLRYDADAQAFGFRQPTDAALMSLLNSVELDDLLAQKESTVLLPQILFASNPSFRCNAPAGGRCAEDILLVRRQQENLGSVESTNGFGARITVSWYATSGVGVFPIFDYAGQRQRPRLVGSLMQAPLGPGTGVYSHITPELSMSAGEAVTIRDHLKLYLCGMVADPVMGVARGWIEPTFNRPTQVSMEFRFLTTRTMWAAIVNEETREVLWRAPMMLPTP